MKAITSLLLLCIALCLAGPSQGQSDQEILAQAHALFQQASDEKEQAAAQELYQQALLRYEQVYRSEENGRLAYNIGNTYYRLGDLGRAVVNYRRAEQELMGDANLQHNLALARAQRQDQFGGRQEKISAAAFNLHRTLPLHLRTQILLGLYVAFWLAIIFWYLKKDAVAAWIAGGLLLAALLAGTSVGLDTLQPPVREGVIVAPEIMARQGDGGNYQAAFDSPLHSGTEFILVVKRGYWLHIELPDGRQCWIPARSAELI